MAANYPYITKVEGVCGGEAIIAGTRIAVWHIAESYYRLGRSVEEMLLDWDFIQPAMLFSALAYYHDHRAEIQQAIQVNSYEYWHEHYA